MGFQPPTLFEASDKRQVRDRVRFLLIPISLLTFMLGLILVKDGTGVLIPLLRGTLSINSPLSALGFGWLFANLALSGSPVAATSLALLDGGGLNPLESLAMITGSRLGAAFVVLLMGFLYMLRGHQRDRSLSAGLLSLLVTQSIYLPAIFLAAVLFRWEWLLSLRLDNGILLVSWLERLILPAAIYIESLLPAWALFPLGFFILLGSFALFDRGMPDLHLDESAFGRVNRLLYRPLASFILGSVVTMFAMSVSLSLSLLVPLSVRGYIRQENIIPYVMGANITTLIDTLLAAALLENPIGLTVILVQMISVALVSLLLLLLFYHPYVRYLSRAVGWLQQSRKALAAYIVAMMLVPFVMLFF
ncbi:MAG: hypothetical protein JXA25_11285 [Anaerolineales bacterium]|nr:hypothetical protein [Anaerolineales bacterium]